MSAAVSVAGGSTACWQHIGVRGDGSCPELPEAARDHEGPSADWVSMMVFRIGGEWLALPTGLLVEVVEPRAVHSLPHRRSGVVLGITNIHGELLICVSLALQLGLEPGSGTRGEAKIAAQKRFLVIGGEANRFAVPVDEVHGIRRTTTEALQPPPATITRAVSSYTRHVLPWEGRSVGYLDGALLLASLNRSIV
jgi:chemotaxis-related protein WspD